jgi:hypothetical protein
VVTLMMGRARSSSTAPLWYAPTSRSEPGIDL